MSEKVGREIFLIFTKTWPSGIQREWQCFYVRICKHFSNVKSTVQYLYVYYYDLILFTGSVQRCFSGFSLFVHPTKSFITPTQPLKIKQHIKSRHRKTRNPCYRSENRAMLRKFSIHIAFYRKSTTERLCTLNTATLSTRAHLAPNSAQNNLNHV